MQKTREEMRENRGKAKEDIAKQKTHLPPIWQKNAYRNDQIDVFNPQKGKKVKTNW